MTTSKEYDDSVARKMREREGAKFGGEEAVIIAHDELLQPKRRGRPKGSRNKPK